VPPAPRSLFFCNPPDFSYQDHGLRLLILLKHLKDVDKIGTDDGIAAYPYTRGLTQPQLRQLPNGFIG
jgi:hypothetical protein